MLFKYVISFILILASTLMIDSTQENNKSVKLVTSVSGHSRSLYSDPISFISGHTNKQTDIFGYYIIDYCPGL